MKTKYFHISAYVCNKCEGPVIAGSFGTRETEIAREGNFSQAGTVCLSCGNKPGDMSAANLVRQFAPAGVGVTEGESPGLLRVRRQSRKAASVPTVWVIATSWGQASSVERSVNSVVCDRQCNAPDTGRDEAKALFQPNPREAQL